MQPQTPISNKKIFSYITIELVLSAQASLSCDHRPNHVRVCCASTGGRAVSSKENLVTGLRTLKMSIFIIIFQRQKFREISNEHTIFSARLWWNYSRQDRYNSIVPLSAKIYHIHYNINIICARNVIHIPVLFTIFSP